MSTQTALWIAVAIACSVAAMMVFESEDAASQAKEQIQPPPDGSAELESVDIAEVVANA